MSTRALRKLQENLDAKSEQIAEKIEISDEEENSENEKNDNAVLNRFAMLDDNTDDHQVSSPTSDGSTSTVTQNLHKVQKRKSKPKKKQQKNKEVKNDEENIDELLKAYSAVSKFGNVENYANNNSLLHSSAAADGGGVYLNETGLFQIEYRNLNPEFEMKRIFGKTILDGSDRPSVQKVQRKVGQHGKRFGGKLVKPKNNDNWAVGKTGLTMELVESLPGGVNLFSFQHGPSYQQAQVLFWDAVESMSPDAFVAILRDHPFHVDTLLQMSDVYRINEDFSYARDLVERSIYVCEAAFHPLFNVALNNSRLEYKQQENRSFFLALFKHMQYMCQRHCYRTALEFCKLIYSLDPDEDPLGMLLYIDYLCLRCRLYDFLINLYHVLEAKRNLSQLPNFCFSVPLALHLKSVEDNSSTDSSLADEKLQEALTKFPTLLMPLLDKCSVEPDKEVSKSDAFSLKEQLRDGKGLTQLITLYIARCQHIWKDANVMNWLEINVRKVLPTLTESNVLYKQFCHFRQVRYQTTPLNVLRHVVIADLKEALASLPPEIREKTITNYDPLPPSDTKCGYNKPERPARPPGSGSFFGSFLRSLLPNYNPDAQPEAAGGAEAGAAAAGGGNELQRSVHALLQAMRDLLNDLQPAAVPGAANNNGNNDNDVPENQNDDEWEDNWDID